MSETQRKKTVNVKEFVADAIAKALESDAFNERLRESVEGIVFEILSEQDADSVGGGGGGGGGGEAGGGAEVDLNQIRRIVAELVEHATGNLDQTAVSAPDPEAIRAVVHEEISKLGLSAGSGGGGGAVDPNQVQAIVAGVLKEEAPRLVARVKKSVSDLVDAAFTERLPASGLDNFVSRAEVSQIIAELAPDGDGGGGGGDGLSVAHAKQLVKDMLETHAISRDEAEALIARGAGEGGGGGGVGLDAAQVRALALEVFAESGGIGSQGGGGGDAEGGPALTADMIRAAIRDEVAKVGGGGGGGGGGGIGDIDPQALLNDDRMKEALDDRFRLMQTFIKQDLVPKLVKNELKKQG